MCKTLSHYDQCVVTAAVLCVLSSAGCRATAAACVFVSTPWWWLCLPTGVLGKPIRRTVLVVRAAACFIQHNAAGTQPAACVVTSQLRTNNLQLKPATSDTTANL